VLAHLKGRKQIVTIHPPLPTREPDAARRLEDIGGHDAQLEVPKA